MRTMTDATLLGVFCTMVSCHVRRATFLWDELRHHSLIRVVKPHFASNEALIALCNRIWNSLFDGAIGRAVSLKRSDNHRVCLIRCVEMQKIGSAEMIRMRCAEMRNVTFIIVRSLDLNPSGPQLRTTWVQLWGWIQALTMCGLPCGCFHSPKTCMWRVSRRLWTAPVSVNGMCENPAVDQSSVQSVFPTSYVNWDRLQQTPSTQLRVRDKTDWWLDGPQFSPPGWIHLNNLTYNNVVLDRLLAHFWFKVIIVLKCGWAKLIDFGSDHPHTHVCILFGFSHNISCIICHIHTVSCAPFPVETSVSLEHRSIRRACRSGTRS